MSAFKGRFDISVATDVKNDELLLDLSRRGLHLSSLRFAFRNVRAHEHGDYRRLGHELAK